VAILLAVATVPVVTRNQFILRLLLLAMYYGALAMAFDFSAGYINIVNFGLSGFVGLGAYTSALMVVKLGVSPWIGMAGGAVLAMLLGLVVGRLTLGLVGLYAANVTWFIALTLLAATAATPNLTRGYLGLNVPPLFDTPNILPYYYLILGIVVVMYVVMNGVVKSHLGLAFKAIGQNLGVARASGINPARYRIINFTLSCTFAGLLGGFYAHFIRILTPAIMGSQLTMEVMTLSYVGGRGTLWGGLIAGLFMIPIFEYIRHLLEVRLIIYGLVLIVVTIYWPKGIVQIGAVIGGKLRKWIKN
jgi:branched-chain amino acid transport system permease protein